MRSKVSEVSKILMIIILVTITGNSVDSSLPCVYSCSQELHDCLDSCNAIQCTNEYEAAIQAAKTSSERDALLVAYQACLQNGKCKVHSDNYKVCSDRHHDCLLEYVSSSSCP